MNEPLDLSDLEEPVEGVSEGWLYAGSSTPMVSEDGVHFHPKGDDE
jgi:hypothetical protein